MLVQSGSFLPIFTKRANIIIDIRFVFVNMCLCAREMSECILKGGVSKFIINYRGDGCIKR